MTAIGTGHDFTSGPAAALRQPWAARGHRPAVLAAIAILHLAMLLLIMGNGSWHPVPAGAPATGAAAVPGLAVSAMAAPPIAAATPEPQIADLAAAINADVALPSFETASSEADAPAKPAAPCPAPSPPNSSALPLPGDAKSPETPCDAAAPQAPRWSDAN